MLMQFVFITLTTFVARSEGSSSYGGVFGKKRNRLASLTTPLPNRFLCPECVDRIKELREAKTDTKIHCMKGEKGDKGEPGKNGEAGPQGPKGTCNEEQIRVVVRPLRAKVDALFSSYTKEIAKLRNALHSIKSKFIHSLGSEKNPAKSCKEIYEQEKYSPSGGYYLKADGVQGGVTKVYCYMEEDEICPAGSTLVLKIDGSKNTFKYSSPLWSNKEVYAEENGATLFDSKETKLPSYWGTPLTKICIRMRKLDAIEVESLLIDETSTSLYDIIANGQYRATRGGRDIWGTLLPGSRIKLGCFREGFNAHGTRAESAGARIGVIASDQSNCSNPDSVVGFGTEMAPCAYGRDISCGNQVGCNTEEYIPAFGYIFVY